MEAGYDYLLVRGRLQQRFIRTSAILLAVTGAILLGAGISYFVYAEVARSGLTDLNYAVTAPLTSSESFAATPSLGSTFSSSPRVTAPVQVAPPVGVPPSASWRRPVRRPFPPFQARYIRRGTLIWTSDPSWRLLRSNRRFNYPPMP